MPEVSLFGKTRAARRVVCTKGEAFQERERGKNNGSAAAEHHFRVASGGDGELFQDQYRDGFQCEADRIV